MTSHHKYSNSTSVLFPSISHGPSSQPPPIPTSSVNKSNITQYDHDVDILLHAISPTYETNEMRSSIINYIKRIFHHYSVGCNVVMGGSYPLKVYLPESDLDVVVLTRQSPNENDDLKDILDIFSCLCRAINENDKIIPPNGNYEEIKIQRIEFVNARIKVVKCVINQTSLDITANQKSSLASATFLEEADRIIGKGHLYKRSVILIKAWCLHESSKYSSTNTPIIGAKVGMFSSYAISILILYLFNILPIDDCLIPSSSQFGIHSTSLGLPGNDSFVLPFPSISHPLHVLRAFLYIYSRFQWESFVFSLDGPAIIKNGTFSNSSGDALSGNSPSPPLPTVNNLFKKIADQVRQSYNSQESIPKTTQTYRPYRFSLRYFNIVDPVDVTNNLGISVPLKNSKTIQTVLTNASQHMESLYAWWHQNCSRSSSHFPPSNPNPTPSMSAPRASYGTPLSIAPGLSSNPQTTLSPTATTMSPTTSILPIAAPISSFPASSPFLPPHATSCFHSQQQYSGNVYHPSHLPVVSQYHPAFQHPKSTEMSSSFLTAFFPQSLISYQSILQNQCVPRRSLPGSTNNLLEPDSEIKLTRRSSPPRKERSSSYTAFSTDQPSKDLSLVEEYDNLDSDIDLMWNSLKFVPSFSSRIPVLETQLSADKETDSPHTTSDNMNLSVDFNFEVEVESSEDPSDHEVLSPEQSSIDYPMKGSTPRPVENPEPFSPYPKNRLNDPVPLEPVKELTGPALSQHKSDNLTKEPCQHSKSTETIPFLSLPNMLLIALSMLLCLLVGFMNVGTDSCDLSITTITQKLFCSSVENLTVHLPPTVPLQPSPPVPVVHATLLAKENAPAYQYMPESEIQTTEVWVLPNQHLTLGLNSFAQDIYYDSTLRKNISGVWLKDQHIYRSLETGCCVSTPHLMLTSVDRPGTYQYVLYDQYAHQRRNDENGIRDSKSSLSPLFSCCVRPEGDLSRSITDNKDYPKDQESLVQSPTLPATILEKHDILRVLSKSFVKLAVPPSSKTKPKHLTLVAGSSQLYLHMQPEGVPPPFLQWYRNGVLLPHETKNILVVNEVNKSHEGTYSCRLTNMAGVYTWLEATVEIRSVPRLPSNSATTTTSTNTMNPSQHQTSTGKNNER